MTNEQVIEARTHGRFLSEAPASGHAPWPTIVGFHGYAEDAGIHLEALRTIPGIDGWLLVSVQALHPFYTREQRVVASWMTKQDREHAIADNIDYVGRVLASVRAKYGDTRPLVFAGFSQGAAMAYRAAAAFAADGVLVLAGDVPPDVAVDGVTLPRVLIGRGTMDEWYTADKHDADLHALRGRAADVENCVFEGGHTWRPEFCAAAGRWLAQLRPA